jgi:hypothetical protein
MVAEVDGERESTNDATKQEIWEEAEKSFNAEIAEAQRKPILQVRGSASQASWDRAFRAGCGE